MYFIWEIYFRNFHLAYNCIKMHKCNINNYLDILLVLLLIIVSYICLLFLFLDLFTLTCFYLEGHFSLFKPEDFPINSNIIKWSFQTLARSTLKWWVKYIKKKKREREKEKKRSLNIKPNTFFKFLKFSFI